MKFCFCCCCFIVWRLEELLLIFMNSETHFELVNMEGGPGLLDRFSCGMKMSSFDLL